MAGKLKVTAQDIERAKKTLYHHVDCRHLAGVRISLTAEGQNYKEQLSIIGLSSRETIRKGLKAVDASPFKTVFVVDEATGQVLYALSKNDDYVARAKKKKKPTPPTGPQVPPTTDCCRVCAAMGGTSCQPLADGSCICFGATRTTSAGIDDSLGEL